MISDFLCISLVCNSSSITDENNACWYYILCQKLITYWCLEDISLDICIIHSLDQIFIPVKKSFHLNQCLFKTGSSIKNEKEKIKQIHAFFGTWDLKFLHQWMFTLWSPGMTVCKLVGSYQHSTGTAYLYTQIKFVWNIGTFMVDYMVSHPRTT